MRVAWTKILLLLTALVFTGGGCISFSGKAAAGPIGVFRSVDKGEKWQAMMALPTATGVQSIAGVKVYRLVSDPSDPNAWYLATRENGILYTYNNGQTWQSVDAMAGKFIYALAVDPINKCVLYASDGQHIYKSEDCTRSWKIAYTEERSNERVVALSIGMNTSSFVFAGTVGGDVIRSDNGGNQWQSVKRFKTTLRDVKTDPFVPHRLYVATASKGLFRSDDDGANWIDLSKDLANFNQSRVFYRLVLNPGQKDSVFWVSKYGILRSDDAGVTWKEMHLLTPPGSVNIYGFAINPKNQREVYYTGTILDDQGQHVRSTFYKSVDGGQNWVTKKLPTNTVPVALRLKSDDPTNLFMAFTSP